MADVMLESVPAAWTVTGIVLALVAGECRRCLTTAVGHADDSRSASCTPKTVTGRRPIRLIDDEVDLEPLVRDAVLLELPHRPPCAEGLPRPVPAVRRQPQRTDVHVRDAARPPLGRPRRPAGPRPGRRELTAV